ncbi:IS3 family transposase [Hymenobacter sp. UYCo722]|uniref:IS3 family transposase n=1 Tax=Hymenobacter sp. UYCo722 TaxID=3156335 RepID=UPI003399AC87
MPAAEVNAGCAPSCATKAMRWAGSGCAAGSAPAAYAPSAPAPASIPPRTTQADPQAVVAANKLASWPAATAPNQIWVGDITYLVLATGHWAYLACWRDAFSRRVVGWHVSESLHTDLMLTVFNRAVAVCQPPPGLLVHADRSSQYTSDAFTQFLDRTQAIASLSRPGNPYNNALAESGWSTLKMEMLPRGSCFADMEEARLELADYLDYNYNTQRLNSALGYCTPLDIELHSLFNLP